MGPGEIRQVCVFEYEDYKAYFEALLRLNSSGRRGLLKALAGAMGVHPSQAIRMLRGFYHPNQEQAYLAAQYLRLGSEEAQYLLSLVSLARATRPSYRIHLSRQLEALRAGRSPAESG